jgi:hypothetical protein
MTLNTFERFSHDAFNFGYAFFGPATSVFLITAVVLLNNMYLYIVFAMVCLGYMIFYMYLYFSNAAKDSTETAMAGGDPGPTNDFYLINIILLLIYTGVCAYEYNKLRTGKTSRIGSVAHGMRSRLGRPGSARVAPSP